MLFLISGQQCNGGFLGAFSLAQLTGKIPGLEYDGTCAETHSHYAKIALVHLDAIYTSYSSGLSFLKYNLVRIREYYAYYIIQGHWHDFKLLSWLETMLGTTVNTIEFFLTIAILGKC